MGLRKPDKTITSGGIVLPELTNPATAADIASSKEAVDQNGVLLTGTLPEVLSGNTETLTLAAPSHASGNIRMTGTMQEDKILRSGSKVMNMIAASYFGNATAEDVAEGKTFTSAAGLNVVGTGKVMTKLGEITGFYSGNTLNGIENNETYTSDFSVLNNNPNTPIIMISGSVFVVGFFNSNTNTMTFTSYTPSSFTCKSSTVWNVYKI